MKNGLLILLMSTFLLTSLSSCKDDTKDDDLKVLTIEEKEDLNFLREEEKLARDVYLFSHKKWGEKIFENISNSEQTHMDKVLDLLNSYGIADPASSDIGVFNNPTLQQLYYDLTDLSDSSLLDALIVGVTIEDLDIKDIALNEGRTNKSDILKVYTNLKCGSTNHMRAFYSNLTNKGGTYTPQFISQAYFNAIVNGSNEKCGN